MNPPNLLVQVDNRLLLQDPRRFSAASNPAGPNRRHERNSSMNFHSYRIADEAEGQDLRTVLLPAKLGLM